VQNTKNPKLTKYKKPIIYLLNKNHCTFYLIKN